MFTHGRMKKLACLLLILGTLWASASPALAVSGSSTLASSGAKYVVTASALNVRSGAGKSYSVIATAYRGKEVTFISSKNGWWYVRLANGTKGYVDKQYLTPVSATETGSYTVTVSTLLMRATPNTKSRRVGKLSKGTVVNVTELNGDWGYVTCNGTKGWVAIKYLAKSSANASGAAIAVGGSYTVTADILNVRKRGSTSAARIGKLKKGEAVRVSQISGSWAYVSYTSGGVIRQGWVSAKYLG